MEFAAWGSIRCLEFGIWSLGVASSLGFGSSFGLRHSGFLDLNLLLASARRVVKTYNRVRQNLDVATDDEVEFLAGRVRPETW